MDVEAIIKGVDPGLKDVFLDKVVEEVEGVLTAQAEEERVKVTSEEEIFAEEKRVEENLEDDFQGEEILLAETDFSNENEVEVDEEDNKILINLRGSNSEEDGGRAAEEVDTGPTIEINLNVIRTQADLMEAFRMNQDPRSRVKFVSRPSVDALDFVNTGSLDYLDFDNDYIVITLENDFDDGSFLRASQPLRKRPLRRRRPRGRRVSLQG